MTHTVLLGALQDNGAETRHPLIHLSRPVLQCRLGHNDQMRARDALVELEVAEEGDGLERLAEALGCQFSCRARFTYAFQ